MKQSDVIDEKVLIEPVLSEKANLLREQGKYVFRVDFAATKIQIKQAVSRLFDVHPVSCNIMVVGCKPKKRRHKAGYTSTWKKAIVRLRRDEKIGLFEGV